jgi:hypothetical protein
VACFIQDDHDAGIKWFVRGTVDLEAFVTLLDSVCSIIGLNDVGEKTIHFKRELLDCSSVMEPLIVHSNFNGLGNVVANILIPILKTWDEVLEELNSDFS